MSDPAQPRSRLSITEEAFQAWKKRVSEDAGELVCQVCGGVDWLSQNRCYEAVEFGFAADPKTKPATWNALPMMVLICTRCGNSLFINALAAGIIPKGGSGAP